MSEEAFFTDEDFEAWRHASAKDIARIGVHLANGGDIVWPADGIGTGRAQLKDRAPKIWRSIEGIREAIAALCALRDNITREN